MSYDRDHKLKIGIFKFASCDGCQLSLLDAEEELLKIAECVEIAYFPEASKKMQKGPYDIALVEGSILTHHDADRIQQVRRQSKLLVAIGACAASGGIQALRNWKDCSEFVRSVYPSPDFVQTLKMSTPIPEHVPVDFELRGCPISKRQLIELLSALLAGRKPSIPLYSVCMECKRRGTVCVSVAQGLPCLGPATQAGCGALCPANGRACYGCFGPMEAPNTTALAAKFAERGHTREEIERMFRGYSAWAWQFRRATEEVRTAS